MGCCASKDVHDEDTERTPLVGTQAPAMNRGMYGPNEEQGFWKHVIHETTRNLIDISSAEAEPLQDQDVEARTQNYLTLLQHLDDDTDSTVNTTTNNNPFHQVISSFDDILLSSAATKTSPPPLEWLDQAVLDIDQALQNIRVHSAGEMVTPLTMPSFY